jgi:hypothetical protein
MKGKLPNLMIAGHKPTLTISAQRAGRLAISST